MPSWGNTHVSGEIVCFTWSLDSARRQSLAGGPVKPEEEIRDDGIGMVIKERFPEGVAF